MTIRRIAAAACVAMASCLLSAFAVAKEQIDESVILVATPELRDRLYGASVLIATPIGRGQHIGFILNQPTRSKLSDVFPDHEPSKKVTEPIFLGGPENTGALFALVQRQGRANSGRLALASNLYLEVERDKVDGVIENEYGKARFFCRGCRLAAGRTGGRNQAQLLVCAGCRRRPGAAQIHPWHVGGVDQTHRAQ